MLNITYKPFMLSVVLLNVVMPSVVAPEPVLLRNFWLILHFLFLSYIVFPTYTQYGEMIYLTTKFEEIYYI
jgi:hypothetical protein